VAGGQSRKIAKPIFGRGLAVRCERSEHSKSQLSKKYLCTILATFLSYLFFLYSFRNSPFFSNLSNSTELSTLFNLIFFASQSHCASRIAHNVLAAWRQAGVSVRFGREENSQIPAKCHTKQHPRLRQTAC